MRGWIAIVVLLGILLCMSWETAEALDRPDPWADEVAPSEVVPRRSPMGEATRSFILPGWGQERMQSETRSFVYGFLAGAMLPFAVGYFEMPFFEGEFGDTLPVVLYGLIATMAAVDAYHLAEQSNRENGWELSLGPLASPRPEPGVRIVLFHKGF